jgi:hypothetical protein
LMMISCFGLDVPGTGMPLSTSISVSLSSLDSSLKSWLKFAQTMVSSIERACKLFSD